MIEDIVAMDNVLEPINYVPVNQHIQELRNDAFNYLQDCLK